MLARLASTCLSHTNVWNLHAQGRCQIDLMILLLDKDLTNSALP